MSFSFVQLLELLPLAGIPDLMCSLSSVTRYLAAQLGLSPEQRRSGHGTTMMIPAGMGNYPVSESSLINWVHAFADDPRQLGLYCFCRMNLLMVGRACVVN